MLVSSWATHIPLNLQLFASSFCGSTGYIKIAFIKDTWHLHVHYYYIKLDEFTHRMLYML